jgi:hypothetical protein
MSRLAPIAIVLGIAVFNMLTVWWTDGPGPPDWLRGVILGAWVFQPMMFGIWAALGPGRFVMRLLLVFPYLLLVIEAPGMRTELFHEVQRFELVTLVVAAMVFLALTLILLLILRAVTGLVIEHNQHETKIESRRFQFDIKYLMLLVTTYAVAMGITTSLKFGPTDPPGRLLGSEFYVAMLTYGGAYVSFAISPIVALALMILCPIPRRTSVHRLIAGWMIVTFIAISILAVIDDDFEMYVFVVPLLLQLGAAITGVIASIVLRLAGYRLHLRSPSFTAPVSAES